jgi:hypothetical protein
LSQTTQVAPSIGGRTRVAWRVNGQAMVWVAGSAAVGLLLRLHDIGRESLWLDEAGRVAIALLPLDRIAAGVAVLELSPPLYHYLLAAWVRLFGSGELAAWVRLFGSGEGAVRALSAVLVVPSVALAWSLGGAVGGMPLAAGLAVAVAVSPFAVHYGQEAAMYALLLPLALATMRAAVGVLVGDRGARPRWLACYGISGALALATHYYALFLLGSISLVGVIHAARLRAWHGVAAWIGVHVAIGLVLAMWAPIALRQVQLASSTDWAIIEPGAALNLWAGAILADGAPPWREGWALALVVVGTALGAWRLRHRPLLCALLVTIMVLPLLAALVLAGSISAFRARGFVALAAGPWLLLIAAVLWDGTRQPWDRALRAALGAALLGATVSGLAQHAGERKEDWRGAAILVATNAGPGDPIFFVHYAGQVAFDRYFAGSLFAETQPRIGLPQSFRWEDGYHAPYRVTPEDVERIVRPAVEGKQQAWVVLSHDAGRGSDHVLRFLEDWSGTGRATDDTALYAVRVVRYSR